MPSLPPLGEPAPLWRRLAAFGYDLLLLAGVWFCFTWAVLVLRAGREIAPGSVWFEASLMVVSAVFFAGFWVRGGQTLGMRAWKIRVVTADGRALDWSRAIVRVAAAFVSLAPAGLGIWWSLLDGQRRTWHDRFAGTLVVATPSRADVSEHAPRPQS